MNDSNPVPDPNMYDNRLEITFPGKLPMGQTIERMWTDGKQIDVNQL